MNIYLYIMQICVHIIPLKLAMQIISKFRGFNVMNYGLGTFLNRLEYKYKITR